MKTIRVRAKIKRRKRLPTALRKAFLTFLSNTLSAMVSSLITAAVIKLLGW